MNGIDAVTIAMGNDWRAVESSVHAYAAKDGQYRGLSRWMVDNERKKTNWDNDASTSIRLCWRSY